jgi:mannosyltransferase
MSTTVRLTDVSAGTSSGRHSRLPAAELALVAGVCALAAVLGAVRLGSKSLWNDDAISDAIARLDLASFWRVITRADAFNALYYGLLHFWIQLFGDSEAALRALSLLAGVLGVFVLFVLARRLFGVRVAAIAGILLAINAFFVSYEQEARAPTLVLLGTVFATLLFVRAVEQATLSRWLAYGAGSALAFYANPFAAFVILAHLLSLPLRRVRPRLAHLAAGYGLAAVLIAPLAGLIVTTDSLSRSFLVRPTIRSLGFLFLEFTGASGDGAWEARALRLCYVLACCVALFLGGRALVRRRRKKGDEEAWRLGLVLLWLLVPVAVTVGVSLVHPTLYDRYLIVALPALATLGAVGMSLLPRRLLVAALVIMVALSAPALGFYYRQDLTWGIVNWRDATKYVLSERRSGDGIIFATRSGRVSFEYYLRRLDSGFDLVPVYPDVPWGEYVPVLSDMNEPVTADAARLQTFHRVWTMLLWAGFVERDVAPNWTTLKNVTIDTRSLARTLREWHREVCRPFGPVLRVCLYVNPSK